MKKVIIVFTRQSLADYNGLSKELRDECDVLLKKLRKVGKSLGKPLQNKNGKDLRGLYKLYFDKARYRIVYKVIGEEIEITEVSETLKETLEITGIGKRDREFIYDLVARRVSEYKEMNSQFESMMEGLGEALEYIKGDKSKGRTRKKNEVKATSQKG